MKFMHVWNKATIDVRQACVSSRRSLTWKRPSSQTSLRSSCPRTEHRPRSPTRERSECSQFLSWFVLVVGLARRMKIVLRAARKMNDDSPKGANLTGWQTAFLHSCRLWRFDASVACPFSLSTLPVVETSPSDKRGCDQWL